MVHHLVVCIRIARMQAYTVRIFKRSLINYVCCFAFTIRTHTHTQLTTINTETKSIHIYLNFRYGIFIFALAP